MDKDIGAEYDTILLAFWLSSLSLKPIIILFFSIPVLKAYGPIQSLLISLFFILLSIFLSIFNIIFPFPFPFLFPSISFRLLTKCFP